MTQLERSEKWLEKRTEITERRNKDYTRISEDAYLQKSHIMDAYRNTREDYDTERRY